ncbi:bactericidal permeability-increasing protein-like isoform X2 [Chiloscyllium plagiosum]|uniref:bactericidal permeability-increasing protein-like isoform X2 n=1 Tax=Chiloscyllium plagiosum TaxID=36176 RepID=UPI001CB7D0A8|nr:bactericidal permeability-increasing protein-like isoform X2 [Chiloscyllium plagiosum]
MLICKMNLPACITLVLIGTAIGKSGLNPGIQSKITQEALEYAKQIAVTVAEKKIKGFQPPDLSGTIDLLGWIDYRITGMYIKSFGLPSSNVGFIPNSGVKFSMDNVYIDIGGQWHVTFGLINDGGTFELNIKDLSAAFIVKISQDGPRPALSYNDCDASLNNFDLQLHGGGSWFYNMFLSQVKNKIKEIAPHKLCSEFGNTIGKLETFIQRLNISRQLDKYVEFDYSLVGEPEITSNSIVLPIKIPKDIPIRLNTSSLKPLMPKVAAQYPNMLMKIAMSASKQPVVRLVPGKLTAHTFTTLEVFAILPNKSLAELFVLDVTASVLGQIFISDMKVSGTVFLNRMDLAEEESKVGPIPTTALEMMLNLGLQKMVIPKINALLKKGFTIPTMGKVSLKNPVLKTAQGLIVITTDIKYRN